MAKKTVTEITMQNSLDATLQKVLDILEAEDEKSFEEKKEIAIQLLKEQDNSPLAETLVNHALADQEGKRISADFWESGKILSASSNVFLRKVDESDKEDYLNLQRRYAVIKSMLSKKAYLDMIWNEYIDDKALYSSIIRAGKYIGYCGIKNTTKKPWEIAIEIFPEWTNQGIGTLSITAMLNEIKSRLGITEYRIRIEPSNYISQRMFEKIGATPNGISKLWIHDQDTIFKCEEDNLQQIDEHLIKVAEKFNVTPRKLLSHVLEYTLSWK